MERFDYHRPVMVDEAIEGLHIQPCGTYVDATFGGGGHSRAIMEHLGPEGHLVGFDQDEDAAKRVESGEWRVESGEWRAESGGWRAESEAKFTFIHENFRHLKSFLYSRKTCRHSSTVEQRFCKP